MICKVYSGGDKLSAFIDSSISSRNSIIINNNDDDAAAAAEKRTEEFGA